MKLVRFLMNLPTNTNQQVTVELKNGTSISGQIVQCTPTMNLSMKNIKLVKRHHDPQILKQINVRGSQIRQILLPDDLNIDAILAKSATSIKGTGAGPGAKPVRKPMRNGKRGF